MKHLLFVLLSTLLGLLCGCNKNVPDDLPPLYRCLITVIQDNTPLENATVLLEYTKDSRPAEGQLWFPMGGTDNEGKARIRTNGRYDGAPLGTYKVIVTKSESGPSKYGPAPPFDSPEYDKWERQTTNEELPKFSLVAEKYGEADKTPHEITITKEGKNELTVDVGKAVKIKIAN